MLEALIVGGIIGAITGLVYWYANSKRKKAMGKRTYEEIASSWPLWDEFVNSFYDSKREQFEKAFVLGKAPNIAELVRKDGILATELNYDDFYNTPIENKLRMLVQTFGEEKKK